MEEEFQAKPVSLAEVKSILKKVSKERKELTYEQKTALEHAEKFARLSLKKTEELIEELKKLGFLQEKHAYKIADLLPKNEDDIKAIFAKERTSLGDKEIRSILDIVAKYSEEEK